LTSPASVQRLGGGQIVLALGVLQALAFAVYLFRSVYTVPYWDTLDWIDAYFQASSMGEWLWQQHVDVRQVVLKSLIALDLWLFGGRLVLIAVVAWATMFFGIAALISAVRRTVSEPGARAFCVGAVLIFGLQTFTLPSYMATNTVQHALVSSFLLFSVATIVGTESNVSMSWGRVCAAISAAALASLSYVNGFLAWPIILWAGWCRGLSARQAVAIVLVGGALAVIHLNGLQPAAGHPDPFRSIAAPADLFWFVVEFFAVPWIKVPVLAPVGLSIGLFIIVVSGLALVATVWRGRACRPMTIIAIAIAAFALGSALMIGLGRIGITDLRLGGTRFGIYVALLHMALMMLGFAPVERLWSRAKARLVFVAAALVVAVPLGVQQVVIGEAATAAARNVAEAGAALRAGSNEEHFLRVIHPDPETALAILSTMRERGVYGFGKP